MRRFIVTGGGGFLGTHLVNRLIQEGYAVTVIDNLSTGQVEKLNPKAFFLQGDVSKPESIRELSSEGVEGIFHLAAQTSGEISFENPYADLQANVGGTLLLLDWCKSHDIRRFIFTSSMGVYGTGSDLPLPESAPCRPKSFYGIGKLAAENYTNLYGTLGLETTILRLFNVYGPMQNMDNMKQGMVSIYMSYLLKNEPILVKGNLDRFRDQTYVADVVDAQMLCLEKPISIDQTYNIATGTKTTVRKLIDTMLKVSGKTPGRYPVKLVDGTPGDIFGSYADVTKAKKELGWSSRFSLEDGIREMYKYYTQEKKWPGEKTKIRI